MKIIKKGTKTVLPLWWHNKNGVCKCGCVVELEPGDDIKLTVERRFNGNTWVELECPTCSSRVILEK